MPRDYIAFDGGYNTGINQGAWAIVLVRDGKEKLLDYGIEHHSKSSDMEWIAAKRAVAWARSERVKVIKGDFLACINRMAWQHKEFSWEWIPSKGNPADKWAKPHEELI